MQGSWERFHLARTRLQFRIDFDQIQRWIWPQFPLKSTTIGPRLGFDRGPRSPSIVVGSSRSDSAAKEVRSRLDRVMIAARSDGDRGVLPRFVCTVRWRSSGEVDGHDRTSPWPSDRDRESLDPPSGSSIASRPICKKIAMNIAAV